MRLYDDLAIQTQGFSNKSTLKRDYESGKE